MVDVIVVGGGLLGMLTARELQQRGATVMILERGQAGGESSWAGGGILSPLYPWRYNDAVNRLARVGHQFYPHIAQSLHDESGVDPEYICSGMLVLDQHENSAAQNWTQAWNIKLEILEEKALQVQQAGLGQQIKSALWLPEIAQLRNPRLIKSAIGSLKHRKIACLENTEVTGFEINKGAIRGVTTHQAVYHADKVVIAGGAWTANIIKDFATPPEIQPVKGQMILFKGEPGLLKTMVLSQGRYLIPRRDGRILAGSTLEYSAFDKSITDTALADLRATAITLLPVLTDLPIEHHWAGLRPGSQQGVPYICAHPEINGLYINSGHYRNGVILGAGSAQLMTDLICGATPTIDPSFYDFDAQH